MLGLTGSIISPNKTAVNQRADAFNFPQAGSIAEANPGNGHTAHLFDCGQDNEAPKLRDSNHTNRNGTGSGPTSKRTAANPRFLT